MKKYSYTKSLLFLFVGLIAWCASNAQQPERNGNNTSPQQATPKQNTNLFFGLLVFNIWDNGSPKEQAKNENTNKANKEKEAVSSKQVSKGNAASVRQKHATAIKNVKKQGSQPASARNSDKTNDKKSAKRDLFARADGYGYGKNANKNANKKSTQHNAAKQQANGKANKAPQQSYTYGGAATASIDQYLQGEKKSLRKDNILEDDVTDNTANPLPYTPIFAAEALYRARVWRLLDTRQAPNALYFYSSSADENPNTRFINILISAMRQDNVEAFSAVDDRFTTPLSFEQALTAFGGVSIDSIYKYQIKEEWVFNNRDGKSYVRILGIAPMITVNDVETPAFWIYYPDLRKSLVRNVLPDPITGGSLTWESIFENRMFTSRILRSTMDAQNGFSNVPLTQDQSAVIQNELNNLGKQAWVQQQISANN